MPRELVRLPLVCGSGRCAAHGAGSIRNGRGRLRGADGGGIRPRSADVRETSGRAAYGLWLSARCNRPRADRLRDLPGRAGLAAMTFLNVAVVDDG